MYGLRNTHYRAMGMHMVGLRNTHYRARGMHMVGLRNIYNWATLRPHSVILCYEPCVIGFTLCTVLLHHHFNDTMWMPLT